MKFTIQFPTRNRPEKFKAVFEKYQNMKSGTNEVNFIISMDNNDPKMNTPDIRQYLDGFKNTRYFYGDSKTKIEAINANLDKVEDFDIMLAASDDMLPQAQDYDNLIANDMLRFFPDLDGVLHYNDGRAGQALDTFCIMGKKYFDRFRYIYHPSYISVYADNEFMEVSQLLGKYVYSPSIIFHHAWVDYVGRDELMNRNEDRRIYDIDNGNYQARKSRRFDL